MSATVANATGSDLCVLLFRVSASVFSVFFRVRPWLILLLLLVLPSVLIRG